GLPDDPPPALPAVLPAGGVELIAARPFTLASPATHAWRKEQPAYTAGVLLVLRAPIDTLVARQTAEPVLYVGAQTAERVNVGDSSGMLVAIVPAETDAQGRVALDLGAAPIFFGEPALPEQVDAQVVATELAAARRAGIAPPTHAQVTAALQEQVAFEDEGQLHLHAADLIEHYAPLEVDVVSGLRAPRVGR
ncbi:MAG TPA: hypothetical protein VK824_11470, partial [Planctomycetota bacterium]|nr:hypothetical protein [Planctomycetota bacterium]